MPRSILRLSSLVACIVVGSTALAHSPDAFHPVDELLPTPNDMRLASGYPGPKYWQQRADYEIDVELDEEQRLVTGQAKIIYHNRSPHTLPYVWLLLDNNIFARDSDAALSATAPSFKKFSFMQLARLLEIETFDGTLKVDSVQGADGKPLPYRVAKTLMRVDPPRPIRPGELFQLRIRWHYHVNDGTVLRARTGYERFDDGNVIFEIAHWYPRIAAYSDAHGWHNDQFLGAGEFTLEFGNYILRITVPSDHIVAATGELTNASQVLSSEQRSRLKQARSAKSPVFIVTPKEAKQNSSRKARGRKTWVFEARGVRDVAWASSRKFAWDALGHKVEEEKRTVMAMSFYPPEAAPLWTKYSTRAVAHTLNVYGKHTFPYPYPVAISVNGPVFGMEYPMICFNGPRPKKDGTYFATRGEGGKNWRHSKYGLISVIIHEVGHNWFPMIVNSDERRWTWMDEGLNTFLQFLAEQEWEKDYPSRRGFAEDITEYMQSRRQSPIMTTSDSVLSLGNNAYAKPATALNILRETILGREVFDDAFKRYARAWRFRRPMPGDFFRLMEDASGTDLDWFWRGWFYSTQHVDIAINEIAEFELDTRDPRIDGPKKKAARDKEPANITEVRNKNNAYLVDEISGLKDFYNQYDPLDTTPESLADYRKYLKTLKDSEKKLLKTKRFFYVVRFDNIGGLAMPIILRVTYKDGTKELLRIPANIWRKSPKRVNKLLMTNKTVTALELDPFLQTADVNMDNNYWPRRPRKTRFQLFKEKEEKSPMRKARDRK